MIKQKPFAFAFTLNFNTEKEASRDHLCFVYLWFERPNECELSIQTQSSIHIKPLSVSVKFWKYTNLCFVECALQSLGFSLWTHLEVVQLWPLDHTYEQPAHRQGLGPIVPPLLTSLQFLQGFMCSGNETLLSNFLCQKSTFPIFLLVVFLFFCILHLGFHAFLPYHLPFVNKR